MDPSGEKRPVIGLTGQTRLKSLANTGLIDPVSHRLEEIDACSGECEVHIAQKWLEKLPPASYDEKYILTRSSRNRVLNKHARLGYKVMLDKELEVMVITSPSRGISCKWVIDREVKVLRLMRTLQLDDVIVGQHKVHRKGGIAYPSYTDDPTMLKDSLTLTFTEPPFSSTMQDGIVYLSL